MVGTRKKSIAKKLKVGDLRKLAHCVEKDIIDLETLRADIASVCDLTENPIAQGPKLAILASLFRYLARGTHYAAPPGGF